MIETQRLYIRPPLDADFNDLYALQSDSEVMRYIGQGIRDRASILKNLAHTIAHQQKYGFSLGSIFDKQFEQFIGRAGLVHLGYHEKKEVEIAYAFHKAYWGMGYATEIVTALIEWGFCHLAIDRLIAITHVENQGSQRVLEKTGFTKIRLIKHQGINCYYYQIERHHFSSENEINQEDKVAAPLASLPKSV